MHASVVAEYRPQTQQQIRQAIDAALEAKASWQQTPFVDRAAIFLKAADLIATKYRYELMAATMLGQGKNIWQAEIDAAAESCDFMRCVNSLSVTLFRNYSLTTMQPASTYSLQPICIPSKRFKMTPDCGSQYHDVKPSDVFVLTLHGSRVEYRPLEGFVYAISPFNFTALAANLIVAPALMGNVVVWKPSDNAILSSSVLYRVLLEAGLPKDVIQFVPGDAETVTEEVLKNSNLAGLHFTGSTEVFRKLNFKIAEGTLDGLYRNYPRVVGETGGKNFHVIHPSADLRNAVVNTVRGAFEYQGQKCSATSRLYVAASVWPEFEDALSTEIGKLKMGTPHRFENFIGPVIHERAWTKITGAIQRAKAEGIRIVAGGGSDRSTGYYVEPTVLQVDDAQHWLMQEEFFGPLLTVYVYPDAEYERTLDLVDQSTDFGLTGSIFANDRSATRLAEERLRDSAGNFYINCKSSGAMVGHQPFGGARASGTNDKAGSANLLSRFVSMRTIKEDFVGASEVQYPSNEV